MAKIASSSKVLSVAMVGGLSDKNVVNVLCVAVEEEAMGTTGNADVSRWINPKPSILQADRLDVDRTEKAASSRQAENCKI